MLRTKKEKLAERETIARFRINLYEIVSQYVNLNCQAQNTTYTQAMHWVNKLQGIDPVTRTKKFKTTQDYSKWMANRNGRS